LIDPLLGPEFVDQVGIAMTPGTELWHLGALDLSEKSTLWTHGGFGIIQSRVTAVTVRTTKPPMLVHVCAKGLSWSLQAAVECRVTLDTGVFGLEASRREKPQQENADAIAFETDHR
jgi:hypothetical protein